MNERNQPDKKIKYSRTRRIINFFKDCNRKKIYQLFEYGIPMREGTIDQIRKNGFPDLKGPVFFLSTGRCGTNWFANHYRKAHKTLSSHEPWPNLAEIGKMAYRYFKMKNIDQNSDYFQLFGEAFLAAREDQIRFSYKTDKLYIETNHYLTFFAPILGKIFKNAKFIHLYRHPAEFVRSAMRRNWYNNRRQDQIEPIDSKAWNGTTQFEKLCWLWQETNSFIEEFKKINDVRRYYAFDFNILSLKSVMDLDTFIDVHIKDRLIRNELGRKINVQKTGEFKMYEEWESKHKITLKNICGDLAEQYGYKL